MTASPKSTFSTRPDSRISRRRFLHTPLVGGALLAGQLVPDTHVQVPLAMLNRHGLIAGATGTGKTKTLQGIAEQLSANGVSVVVADIR